MTEDGSKKFLVFGLTGAGKSTFAAALWHLLDSRDDVPTVLKKGLHSGNFAYLEKISQRWCDGWRLERTKTEEVEDVRINLLHEATATEFSLEFKDIAGESLETAFSTRYCDPEFVDLVKQTDGMLLFVSADHEIDDVTILDFKQMMGDDDEDDEPTGTDEDDEDERVDDPETGPAAEGGQAAIVPSDPPFDPAKTPLQVRLVDLLQSLRLDPFRKKPFRVAVIVSAWDLAKETSAEEWLARCMPLLDQFLRGGEIADAVRVYGVSAQGGTYPKKRKENRDDERRKQIMEKRPASKRIQVVGYGAGEHDLTHPVRWLSGLEATDRPER
jgi:GTPase SAR1 family protein